MAKISAKGAIIYVDDSAGTPRDISTNCVSYEIQQDAGALDVTGFGDGSKNFIPGLPVVGITLDVLYNSGTSDSCTSILRGILNSSTAKTVTIQPETSDVGTSDVFTGEYMLDAFGVKGTPDGSLQIGSIHFSVMGATGPSWV